MAHRRPRQKDFVGKTIKAAYTSADNIIRLWFTDGTAIAIEAETFTLAVCDECVGECPVPKPKKVKSLTGREASILSYLAQGRMSLTKEQKRNAYASLEGYALRIAWTIMDESVHPSKAVRKAADGFIEWAASLSPVPALATPPIMLRERVNALLKVT